MKKSILLIVLFCISFTSCRVINRVFQRKEGCGTNGKNIGAEKILSGNPKAIKAARKAKKYRLGKY